VKSFVLSLFFSFHFLLILFCIIVESSRSHTQVVVNAVVTKYCLYLAIEINFESLPKMINFII
jgi:hypothetical protein